MNTFGTVLKMTTFGESHGPALGVVMTGVPAGLHLHCEQIVQDLTLRRVGQSHVTSARAEPDVAECLSGLFRGKTTGAPLTFMVRNCDQRSEDYPEGLMRPGHADFTVQAKYGIRDHRGGGRSSARETVARVIAGAVARQIVPGMRVFAYTSALFETIIEDKESYQWDERESSIVRCPDAAASQRMVASIEEGDSVGGVISCWIHGCPLGLGEPVFDKLPALLAHAMMSIPAARGFECGEGFGAARMKGSVHNARNGGTQGGISNGTPIFFRTAFKPVSSIGIGGRHDACVIPRAVVIVEAMAAWVIADCFLRQRMAIL